MENTNIDYWEEIVKNPTPIYKKLFEEEENFLLSHISKNSKVLDIGCGYGRTIKTISSITNEIVGIDNDEKAVEQAKGCKLNIMCADVFNLPFPDKSFDHMVLMMTLVNFSENKARALKEMRRALRDDGKITISVYSEDALPARLEMYKIINVPIDRVEGTKVIFNESIGANISEQFSKEEFEALATEVGLKISDYKKIDQLAYIFELKKK